MTVTASQAAALAVGDVFLKDDFGRYVFGKSYVEFVPVVYPEPGWACQLHLPTGEVGQCDTYHELNEFPTGNFYPGGQQVTLEAVATSVFRLGTESRDALTTEDGTPVDIER